MRRTVRRGIYCMNDKGEQLWHQSEIGHHHSMNKGLGESMWVCAYDLSEASHPFKWRSYTKWEG